MSCGVGCRFGSDLVIAVAVVWASSAAGPLAWELPYAEGMALNKETKRVLDHIIPFLSFFFGRPHDIWKFPD